MLSSYFSDFEDIQLTTSNRSTNVFWRQIRNFIIDTTSVPPTQPVSAIHWPTGQATSLQNIVFQLSAEPGTQHVGVFIEDGSGGFVTDLTFYGGNIGANVGNQQFTMRNLTFFNANTAIKQIWDWGWTYHGININNCNIGIDMSSSNNGFHSVGSVTLIDSTISNTTTGIITTQDSNTQPGKLSTPSLILENVVFNNVGTAVQGPIPVQGSSNTITVAAFGEGNSYSPSGKSTIQGTIDPNSRPPSLLSEGLYYTRSKPQYEDLSSTSFISVRDYGATGDGQTDDTTALMNAISAAKAGNQVLLVDAGTYKVSQIIYIPAGSRIVGEAIP
jgi:glucan 1,3-beta-glucosidase